AEAGWPFGRGPSILGWSKIAQAMSMPSIRLALHSVLAISLAALTGQAPAEAAAGSSPSQPSAHAHAHSHAPAAAAHDHAPDRSRSGLAVRARPLYPGVVENRPSHVDAFDPPCPAFGARHQLGRPDGTSPGGGGGRLEPEPAIGTRPCAFACAGGCGPRPCS